MSNKNNNEELSYQDREKWFRYHMNNSKISEKNAWKQINEMIRILYQDYLDKNNDCLGNNPFKRIIEKIYYENQDMFNINWEEDNGNGILIPDYNSIIGLIWRNLDEANIYLIESRDQKLKNTKPETEDQNKKENVKRYD
jgi:hypothetical protein